MVAHVGRLFFTKLLMLLERLCQCVWVLRGAQEPDEPGLDRYTDIRGVSRDLRGEPPAGMSLPLALSRRRFLSPGIILRSATRTFCCIYREIWFQFPPLSYPCTRIWQPVTGRRNRVIQLRSPWARASHMHEVRLVPFLGVSPQSITPRPILRVSD
ncbi:hypothetical protein B0H11DRAFT_571568 [Mycena galericulata]|nr:hypothetical protein B0H11DRAFT_571568 [Mycena galericulata]